MREALVLDLGGTLLCLAGWACPFRDSPYRKPRPGMLLGLADKHFVDLARSTMVGDAESDRACADAAGVGRFLWARDFFQRPGGDAAP